MYDMVSSAGVMTEVAYAYVIQCHNSLNNYFKAVATIKEMEAKGVPPGQRSYQEALAAAARQLDLTTAMSLLDSMREKNVTVGQSVRGRMGCLGLSAVWRES